ncbi:IS66 family insertion sequence element accessory protein TnpB [Bradyrhizobium sp. CCBAU 51753]|uniref:IS66 family insertion sequence element accessory protein TnpB n=1 Tax=Bradyrhizobium sp. CCBAU 51753 TaxID=1325100 RepID=UPI001FED9A3B|nr:IS66 family insertion sequence element accessory protein TnpB [Bradyrhizobium sp. CCBAU 51753]
MDSAKVGAQSGSSKWLRWGDGAAGSEDEKLKIVLESLEAPRQVTATTRWYGISRSLLLRWRQLFRPEPKQAAAQFVPARVVSEWGAAFGPLEPTKSGAIEIEFAAGARIRITGAVDAVTLKADVAALDDGRLR